MTLKSVHSVCLVGLVLVLVGPVVLGAQASPLPKESTATAPKEPPAPVDSALAKRGRELADQYSCRACHAYKASEPKALGPSLHGVFQRRGTAYLDQKLADPRFDNPASQMPKLALTASQRRAIVEFLRTLD